MTLNQPPLQPWRFAVTVPDAAAGAFADGLSGVAETLSIVEMDEGAAWMIEGLDRDRPDQAALGARIALLAAACGIPEPRLTVERLTETDWLGRVYQGFPPLCAGRFHVRGSHIAEPPPAATRALVIDAATAFGSGEHGSTYGCLMALDALSRHARPRRILDMGCGSGILGLAAARAWPARISMVDIDPESARVSRLNARRNRLSSRVRIAAGNGYHTPLARTGPAFDLIVANILARPLRKMARQLIRRLAPGGRVVLAGLLARQGAAVLAAHRWQGLRLVRRRPVGPWMTLELRRR
jgi:ribosomal protein L11 methyltransferase